MLGLFEEWLCVYIWILERGMQFFLLMNELKVVYQLIK